MAKKAADRGRFNRLVQFWVPAEIDDAIDELVAGLGGLATRAAYLRKVLADHIAANTKKKGATKR